MRFKLIDEAKKQFPIYRLCRVPGVSESGYHAWKQRGPGKRQLDDMVLPAHIRSQFELSHETYGSSRMHVELCEEGLSVGRHRVARLMRDNAIKALQKADTGKPLTAIMAVLLLQSFSTRTSHAMDRTGNGE